MGIARLLKDRVIIKAVNALKSVISVPDKSIIPKYILRRADKIQTLTETENKMARGNSIINLQGIVKTSA